MTNSSSDSSEPVRPTRITLDSLIGDWSVWETHDFLAYDNLTGETSHCNLASSLGTASCERVFGELAVLYKSASNGHFDSGIVDTDTNDIMGHWVARGVRVLVAGDAEGFTRFWRSATHLFHNDGIIISRLKIRPSSEELEALAVKVQRPFKSEVVLFLQINGECVIGSFHLPHSIPLSLSGSFRGPSFSFETDDLWPCSTLLAELFARLQSGECPLPMKVVVVLRPVSEWKWILAVYHVLSVSEKTTVVRSCFTHTRRADDIPRTQQQASPEATVDGPNGSDSVAATVSELSETALTETRYPTSRLNLRSIEDELLQAQEALSDAEWELEELGDERFWSEHEIAIAESAFLAPGGTDSPQTEGQSTLDEIEEEICRRWREFFDCCDQVTDKENEVASLDAEVWELEDLLENGVREWQEVRVREAERIVAELIDVSALPSVDLAEFRYVADYGISDDVLTLLRTVLVYRNEFMPPHGKSHGLLDFSPLIGAMAKTCERLFCDAFSVRRSCLSAVPEVALVLKNPRQFDFEIPAEDKEHKIDKGSLCNVLNKIEKNDSDSWSSNRNAAIVLLLFGRHHQPTYHNSIEIRNPLGVAGTDADRTKLRVALYRLQSSRNGFTHHDVATLDDVKQFEPLFAECVRGLVELLYSRK